MDQVFQSRLSESEMEDGKDFVNTIYDMTKEEYKEFRDNIGISKAHHFATVAGRLSSILKDDQEYQERYYKCRILFRSLRID